MGSLPQESLTRIEVLITQLPFIASRHHTQMAFTALPHQLAGSAIYAICTMLRKSGASH